MDNKLENVGFILRTILNVVDLAFPNHKINLLAQDEKRAFIVMIMDECHKIVRLNSNIHSNTISTPNISTKEGN